jgi:hypothetical protein
LQGNHLFFTSLPVRLQKIIAFLRLREGRRERYDAYNSG